MKLVDGMGALDKALKVMRTFLAMVVMQWYGFSLLFG